MNAIAQCSVVAKSLLPFSFKKIIIIGYWPGLGNLTSKEQKFQQVRTLETAEEFF